MITLNEETAEMIRSEMESIPEKYQKPFNSTHEGYAVLLEEVRELEHVVFFGEKECRKKFENDLSPEYREGAAKQLHKRRLRGEAIQIAAMACRIIQELT
jgi:hypothetical protein